MLNMEHRWTTAGSPQTADPPGGVAFGKTRRLWHWAASKLLWAA
jgi:hypothetical protein